MRSLTHMCVPEIVRRDRDCDLIGEWRSRGWSKRDRPTDEQQLLVHRRRTLPRVSNQPLPHKLKLNALSLYSPPCFSTTSIVATTHQRRCRRRVLSVTIYSLRSTTRDLTTEPSGLSLCLETPGWTRSIRSTPKTPPRRCTLRLCLIFFWSFTSRIKV